VCPGSLNGPTILWSVIALIVAYCYLHTSPQPIVHIPDVGYVQDSAEIAKALDAKYPFPSLHLDDPRVNAAIEAGLKFLPIFSLYIVSLVPSNLPDRDAEYFHRTRQQFLGKPLSQITAETDVDALVTKGKAESGELLALLEKEDGPFILGNTSQFYVFTPFSFDQLV
jgi:glutathione S-transferase